MSNKTSIEWTRGDDGTAGATWNPVRGCVKVSPGCKHCYAETFAERFRGVPGHPYEQGFDPRLVPEKLGEPLRWKKARRIFVNSMSDLFGEFVRDDYIAAVFGVMGAAEHHAFQVLTKRAERLPRWFEWIAKEGSPTEVGVCHVAAGPTFGDLDPEDYDDDYESRGDRAAEVLLDADWPLPNVHLGVSVEDRRYGVPRIDHLRNTPAAVRFLSIEPLLEDVGKLDLTGIHQVIVGAESGRRARPMNEDWVRSIRDQAKSAGCAFFYKQKLNLHGKKVSLPILDGQQWAEMPVVGGPT